MNLLRSLLAVALLAAAVSCFAQQDAQPAKLLPEVRVMAGNSVGTGTVFYIDKDNNAYVLTNHHVAGRRGNRCGIEWWGEDGRLRPTVPARVVESRIDNGGVDVAFVMVAAADIPGDTGFIPLALPDTLTQSGQVIISRGCPGGTWATEFRGHITESTRMRFNFFPRPGGGRSGSAMIRDGRIVGLLTWSSGRPGHESHGTDGRNYRSGFGIAQQIGVIWSVARGQTMQIDMQLPEDAEKLSPTPRLSPEPAVALVWEYQDETTPPQESHQDESGLKNNPKSTPQSDDGFSFTPEQQESFLRRRLGDKPQQQQDGPKLLQRDREDAPRLLPRRSGPGPILQLFRMVFWVVVVLIVFVIVVYFVGRKKGMWIAFLLLIPSLSHAQTDELADLAERWSRMPVTFGNDWGTYKAAYESHQEDGLPIITLITIPGCKPCEQLKEELRSLDKVGWFNQAHTSIVDARENPALARALTSGMEVTSYPVLVVQVPDLELGKVRKAMRMGLFAPPEDADKPSDQRPPTLEEWIALTGICNRCEF